MASLDITTPATGRVRGLFRPATLGVVAVVVLLGALVVLARPAPVQAPASAFSAPSVIEDWRGNSASMRPAQ